MIRIPALILLLLIMDFPVLSQINLKQLEEMSLRSVTIKSSQSSGSAFIAHSTAGWNYAFTAKHVVPASDHPSETIHYFAQVLHSKDSIPCEVVFRDTLLDFAILRFQSKLNLASEVTYDSIPDININYHLISAINAWTPRPIDNQKAQLISINNDEITQKIYMTGLDSGDSGSGFFSARGFAGIVWLKEGDIIHTISCTHMRKMLNLILSNFK